MWDRSHASPRTTANESRKEGLSPGIKSGGLHLELDYSWLEPTDISKSEHTLPLTWLA